MTAPAPAATSHAREARTDPPGDASMAGSSPRRWTTRRRIGAHPRADNLAVVQLVRDPTVPGRRDLPAAEDAPQPLTGPQIAAVCPTCEVEFDAFTRPAEAAFFAMIHNGLHHAARPVAVVSPPLRPPVA
jgi:hypothetical protein